MGKDADDARALSTIGEDTGARKDSAATIVPDHSDDKDRRPALPERPRKSQDLPIAGLLPTSANRPSLSKPTTALSSVDIQTLSFPDGTRGTFDTPAQSSRPTSISGQSSIPSNSRKVSRTGSEFDDGGSLMSYANTMRYGGGDLDSLLGEGLGAQSPAWKLLSSQAESVNPFEAVGELRADDQFARFEDEFTEIAEVDTEGGNEEALLLQWKAKYKHYLILSSAGKPIWSRHGDLNLINGYIGIIQTIISFYEGSKDPLKSFAAGGARFVVSTEGPLYFVAISRLNESEAQLRSQLDALYMQILSTLTLPTLTHIFKNRPNSDLQRPLQGTEPLLASLADTFTKGSPTVLLSALECLKIRKSQRAVINNTLLKTRTDKLLYGLVVAGGRLVSVVRPKKHSLHPSDLQLIFNMLFEAGSIKAGGGENWIPLCLPGFNNRGYLYMYVSFLSAYDDAPTLGAEEPTSRPQTANSAAHDDEIAILLISADKESFFDLKKMRDEVVSQLYKNGSMAIIKSAIQSGRPSTTTILPGTTLRHFLYKSRANVQFAQSSYAPYFTDLVSRRRLMSLYGGLHAAVHAKHTHLKVLHAVNRDSISLAWLGDGFEFYCVAGPNVSRAALLKGAEGIVRWVKREEERLFIIGGAVF